MIASNDPGWNRISLAEAAGLYQRPGALIWWRPEPALPESQQYALAYGDSGEVE